MDLLDELIGFLVVLFIFFFPLIRRLLLRKKKAQQPPEERAQESARSSLLVRAPPPAPFQKEEPTPMTPPTSQRTVKRDYAFHSDLEEFQRASQIETRHLDIAKKPEFKEKITSASFLPPEKSLTHGPSHLTQLLREPSLKKMVILHEIFQPPKGLE